MSNSRATPSSTVAEIIAALQKMPADARVGYFGKSGLALIYTVSIEPVWIKEELNPTIVLNAWDHSGVRKGFPPAKGEDY